MNDLESHKRRIKGLVESGRFEEAIAQCNSLIAAATAPDSAMLRLRAYAHASQGMFGEAISDREAVITSGDGEPRDYYQLGDNSLSAGRYPEAIRWFTDALRIGAEQGETWFDSASWLLLAYAQIRLGQFQAAEISLDKAAASDPECAMPVRGEGVVSHQSLRAELKRLTK